MDAAANTRRTMFSLRAAVPGFLRSLTVATGLIPAGLSAQNAKPNRVLELSGAGDFVVMGEKGPVMGVPFTVEAAVFVLEDLEDKHYGVFGGAKDLTQLQKGAHSPADLPAEIRSLIPNQT